ncbi:helix-turn-helix domain-containing protein [Anaerofustis sp.]|uniref:helix-turn-helix domain-containing protein n=1 Tax=Anaerofustis sp. TaxID=1872517 RepID=UPI0025BB1F08|nr:helix-turn-helix domain-containing protein [Anaerofustis sp.]
MEIIRVEKNKNYIVMSRDFLQRKDLSLKAKGLLAYILSLPDEWDLKISGLEKVLPEGRDSIQSAFKELINKSYIEKKECREKGKFSIEYVVYESPLRVNRDGLTVTENPLQNNNIKINNNNKKKNIKKKKYGELENVLLTEEEYLKLTARFKDTVQGKIDNLSYYIASTGKKYKSHYMTILNWERKAYNSEQKEVVKDNVYSRF